MERWGIQGKTAKIQALEFDALNNTHQGNL